MSESDVELVRASSLFDEDFYRSAYPDVIHEGLDPAEHYVLYGAHEGRDPGTGFSSDGYLTRYPDVARSGQNPLVHYLRVGSRQGRLPDPMADDARMVAESGYFDEEYYRHFRPTLAEDVDALQHYLKHGVEEGLDPSERFSTTGYLTRNPDLLLTGMSPLVHFLRHGRAEGRTAVPGRPRRPMFELLYAERWPALMPLRVMHQPALGRRVTVLTDSVAASSLFGGVGTALMLGILLANRLGATLRLATRTDEPDAGVLPRIEQANGLALEGALEVAHIPLDSTRPLAFSSEDVLVTTSWWTTRAALDSSIQREQVVYLLQEDERMFYPYGDERLLCAETLDEPDLTVVVNTERLLSHLVGDSSLPHLRDALRFEPAFPGRAGRARQHTPDGKRNFFFYSRPHATRNLFWRGGQALSRAIEEGVLPADRWEFYFVGRGTPDLTLPDDVVPHAVEGLGWDEYQALIADMDAALALMDTPHPSYPPYDLAAAGAVVLTNSHPGKTDLSDISENILVAEPSVDGLVVGLRRAAELAQDDDLRARNVARDHISRDWHDALGSTVEAVLKRLPEQFDRAALRD